ncbi:EAL domain-containing protein [Marinobacter sp. MBR-105]
MKQTSKPRFLWVDNRKQLMQSIVLCIRFPLLDPLSRHQGPKFTAQLRKMIERRVAKVTEDTTVFWSDSCVIVPVAKSVSRSMLDTMLEGLYERLIAPFVIQQGKDRIGPTDWYLTPFIGVKFPPHLDYDDAIRCSKAAAHRATAEDMATACLYDPLLESQEAMELLQHQFLLKAIREERLGFHYQPQIEMETGILRGFEVLIRPAPTRDPRLASMSAKQMINLAAESNLLIPLTEFVVRSALRTAEQWSALTQGTFRLSINIDPYTLLAGWERLKEILMGSPFRHSLVIEITEIARGGSSYDMVGLKDRLRQLQMMDIEVSIDDFGSGLANLDRIAELPFDELKLDRQIVQRAPTNSIDAAVVQAVVATNQMKGCRVVAEGIETPEQWDFCKSIGCDIGQGYLLGRPQPGYQALQILQRQVQREHRAWESVDAWMAEQKI